MKKRVHSLSPFEHKIGFARAYRVGEWLAVSGTAPISVDGSTVGVGDVYKQTLRCLEISKVAIEDASGLLDHVIRVRLMLTDISLWEDAARAYGEYFSKIKPACTFMEVSRFINPDWLIITEIDCLIKE